MNKNTKKHQNLKSMQILEQEHKETSKSKVNANTWIKTHKETSKSKVNANTWIRTQNISKSKVNANTWIITQKNIKMY